MNAFERVILFNTGGHMTCRERAVAALTERLRQQAGEGARGEDGYLRDIAMNLIGPMAPGVERSFGRGAGQELRLRADVLEEYWRGSSPRPTADTASSPGRERASK
jgi:hypothetical protein